MAKPIQCLEGLIKMPANAKPREISECLWNPETMRKGDASLCGEGDVARVSKGARVGENVSLRFRDNLTFCCLDRGRLA